MHAGARRHAPVPAGRPAQRPAGPTSRPRSQHLPSKTFRAYIFSDKIWAILQRNLRNFCKFSQISLKHGNLRIIFCKMLNFCKIENSGKICWNFKFAEILQNLLSPLKIHKKFAKFCKKWCEGSKNHRNLELCKGKTCRARSAAKRRRREAPG